MLRELQKYQKNQVLSDEHAWKSNCIQEDAILRNQCCKWLTEALQESLREAKVGGICLPNNLGFDETSVLTLRSGGISVQIRR